MSTSSYVKIVIFNVRLHIMCRFVYYAFWRVRTISEPMHMHTCVPRCYDYLCRPILSNFGIWDQVRVDHGKEWYLLLFIQEKLGETKSTSAYPDNYQEGCFSIDSKHTKNVQHVHSGLIILCVIKLTITK